MSDPKCYGICVKNTKVFGLPNNDFMKKINEGTILEIYYVENDKGIIFGVYDDEMSIDNQMYCGLTEDFVRVNNKLWPFLVGIKNPVDRSKLIKNRELTDFILSIEINDEVLFKMDKNQNLIKGFVRYITLVPSYGPGLFFGIEVPVYRMIHTFFFNTKNFNYIFIIGLQYDEKGIIAHSGRCCQLNSSNGTIKINFIQ